MTVLQVANAWTCYLAAALAVAALILRGQLRFCRLFGAYLLAMLLMESLITAWPERFWTWSFWLFSQTVYDLLKIGTALELGYWIFMGFPGAARTARATVFLFLVATLLAVLVLPVDPGDVANFPMMSATRARLELGTTWVFTALMALVWWYRVPLHAMHRAIIVGFVVYLTVFGTTLKVAGGPLAELLAAVRPLAYTAVCWFWAWKAWAPAPAVDVEPETVARLQPWRAR